MKIMIVGTTPSTRILAQKIRQTGHSVFELTDPAPYRIISSVHKMNSELLITTTPLQTTCLPFLLKHNIPIVGWSLWSDALQNETYQTKLLLMLREAGLPVRDGGSTATFAVVGWWNGLTFTFSYLTYNARHLMTGEVGPLLESAWTLSLPLLRTNSLCKLVLEPLVPFLNRVSYRGSIIVGCTQYEESVAVVRLDAGWYFDSDLAVWEVLQDPLLLLIPQPTPQVLHGLDCFGSLHLTNASCDTIVEERAVTHCVVVGGEGCITARGRYWREVRRRLYRTVERLAPSTISYRTDYGVNLPSSFQNLLPPLHVCSL